MLDLLRQKRCDYILGLSRNKTLDALAAPWREQCRWYWKPGPKVRRFHQFQYAAESWSHQEKVIARVEATDLGTDARFIVTSLTGRGKHLYEKVYCARGRMAKNLIKDMKLSTRSDKTACSALAGQPVPPVPAHGRATGPALGADGGAKRSRWRGATFATIRSVFVKIAVRVEELKRSIKLASPGPIRTPMRWRSSPAASPRRVRDRRGRCRPSPSRHPPTRAKRKRPAAHQPSTRPMPRAPRQSASP